MEKVLSFNLGGFEFLVVFSLWNGRLEQISIPSTSHEIFLSDILEASVTPLIRLIGFVPFSSSGQWRTNILKCFSSIHLMTK